MAFVKRIFMKTKMAEKNKSNKKGKSSSTKKKENTNKSASSKTTPATIKHPIIIFFLPKFFITAPPQ